MAFDLAVLLQLFGAALVVALGLAVVAVRQRGAANVWFAVFAVSFGAQFIVTNMGTGLEDATAWWYVAGRLSFRVATVVGAVGLALTFPTPVADGERRRVALAAALAAAGGVLWVFTFATASAARFAADVAFVLLFQSLFFLLFVFALRYPRLDANARAQVTLMSGALLLYTGFATGSGASVVYQETVFSRDGFDALASGIQIALLAALAGVWLANARASASPRPARNVALLALATPLAGMVYVAYVPDFGMLGIARTLMAAVLAYAIVQHQLLGIDLKVRWGISKTTVAAAFIAVFFIASEAAQTFFGEQLQNEYVGIAAAGLLVLAIAPLQRLADKVAAKAVPVAGGTGDPDRRAESLRTALRLAYRDGTVTAQEEMDLAHIASELGFRPDEYLALRTEVVVERGDR